MDYILIRISKHIPRGRHLQKNTFLDDKHISIISVTKVKSYKGTQQTPFKATIRISNLIRDIIAKQGNRLFLGSQTCKVYDSFFVPRCYNCQEFGHHSKNCEKEQPTCGFCAGEHETKGCSKKDDTSSKPICINCKRSSSTDTDISHYAGSFNCPLLIAKQQELKKRIPFH